MMLMGLDYGVTERLVKEDRSGVVDVDVQRHVVGSPVPGDVLAYSHQGATDTGSLNLRGDVHAE
jgi:hypothetical protein